MKSHLLFLVLLMHKIFIVVELHIKICTLLNYPNSTTHNIWILETLNFCFLLTTHYNTKKCISYNKCSITMEAIFDLTDCQKCVCVEQNNLYTDTFFSSPTNYMYTILLKSLQPIVNIPCWIARGTVFNE
jgi:hypothetical protein